MTRRETFTRRRSARLAALLGLVAVVGLAPLVRDQFVLFADPEARAAAAGARAAMAWPAGALVGAALLLAAAGRRGPAVLTALPLSTPAVAWLVPDTAGAIFAYIASGPAAAGACIAVLGEGSTGGRRALFLAIGGVALLAALVNPIAAAALVLGGGAVWSLRRRPGAGPSPAA